VLHYSASGLAGDHHRFDHRRGVTHKRAASSFFQATAQHTNELCFLRPARVSMEAMRPWSPVTTDDLRRCETTPQRVRLHLLRMELARDEQAEAHRTSRPCCAAHK